VTRDRGNRESTRLETGIAVATALRTLARQSSLARAAAFNDIGFGAVTGQIEQDLINGPVQPAPVAQPPVSPGFYAWWCRTEYLVNAAPAIPLEVLPPIPSSWSLLYVGISPARPDVNRTLADRVGKDHSTGKIGGSTFRQSVAALLFEHLCLKPKPSSRRSKLVSEVPLSQWINRACGLTFAQQMAPWVAEAEVIGWLNPPLNILPGPHPFASVVSDRRLALRQACGL
jgi:hypothetical protein